MKAYYNCTDEKIAIAPSPTRLVHLLNKGDSIHLTDGEWEFVKKNQPGIEDKVSDINPLVKKEKYNKKFVEKE